MLASGPLPHSSPITAARGVGDGDGEFRMLVPLFLVFAFLFILSYMFLGVVPATAVGLACVAVLVLWCTCIPLYLTFLRLVHGHGAAAAPSDAALDASAIAALPAFRYKREPAAGGWAQCAICLRLVRAGEAVRRLPLCAHLFHVACVDVWLRAHATCPLCRATVGSAQQEPPV